MKFLVLSDNHGNYSTVEQIINEYRNRVDYILHCGDSEFSFEDSIWHQVDAKVAGNMDFSPGYPNLEMIDSPFGRILMTHGHLYHVNRGNRDLLHLAIEKDATIVLHGHTHRLYAEMDHGILFVNPGSIAQPRGEVNEKTFAIVELTKQYYQVDFYNTKNQLLEDLTYNFKLNGAD